MRIFAIVALALALAVGMMSWSYDRGFRDGEAERWPPDTRWMTGPGASMDILLSSPSTTFMIGPFRGYPLSVTCRTATVPASFALPLGEVTDASLLDMLTQ